MRLRGLTRLVDKMPDYAHYFDWLRPTTSRAALVPAKSGDEKASMKLKHTDHSQIFPIIQEVAVENGFMFDSMLDVGSGLRTLDKWFLNFKFSTELHEYYAAEVDEDIISKLAAAGISTIDLFKEDRPCDLVVAAEVLEHILPEDSLSFLDCCKRNTRKLFAMTVPNFEYWHHLKAEGDMKECRWLPDHFKDFNPRSDDPHMHKQEMTPEVLMEYVSRVFDKDNWGICIMRAWPWRLTDVARKRDFELYFKLFAIAVRRTTRRDDCPSKQPPCAGGPGL